MTKILFLSNIFLSIFSVYVVEAGHAEPCAVGTEYLQCLQNGTATFEDNALCDTTNCEECESIDNAHSNATVTCTHGQNDPDDDRRFSGDVHCSDGYWKNGTGKKDVCEACATVSGSSARTCDAGDASDIQTVTCNTGFHESGSITSDRLNTTRTTSGACSCGRIRHCSTRCTTGNVIINSRSVLSNWASFAGGCFGKWV